jgi:hypothetical protein
MKQILKDGKMVQLVLLLALVPAMAWGQHKPSGGGGGGGHAAAPAPHASAPSHSAPSHASAPARSAPSHSAAQTHSAPSHSTPSHSTAPTRSTQSAGGNRPAAGGNKSAAGGNRSAAGGNRPAAGGNKSAAGGNRPAAGGNRPGAAAGRGNFHQPAGTRNVSLKNGGSASVRKNGSIRSVDRGGMHIEHGVRGGGRTVVSQRNGARIVTHGHGGYVQRAYVTRGGRSFYSRTYVSGGFVHVGIYRGYFWGGRSYFGWYPGFFYAPAFYGWGFRPWGVPLVWGVSAWGWGGPWWGVYGGWWNPYPVYTAPYFWLTDYLIAENLRAAYAARAEDAADSGAADSGPADSGTVDSGSSDNQVAPASGPVALSPEVKQAIAEEVKAQLAAQQAQATAGGETAAPAPTQASGAPPAALDPAKRTFVVDTAVTAVSADGQECGLTSGDVVTRLTDTPDGTDNTVNASVAASKKGDCVTGATVAVKVDDLQEMYNHFEEQLATGMGEMAKKQGTNGMPKAPDTSTKASDVPPPKPDPDAAKTLQDQQAEADKTEADVKAEAAAGGGL